jgi:hypothetical protein
MTRPPHGKAHVDGLRAQLKNPGHAVEEAKARLRLEEAEAAAAECAECARVRAESADATAYCAEHLAKIYGV